MRLQAILLAAAVAAGSPAAAQGIGGLVKDTGLVDSDFAMMEEAAGTLYKDHVGEVGSEATWENPETGARGAVELTSSDGRCVEIRHVFKSSPQADPDQLSSRRCRNEAGDWVLSLE